MAKLTNQTDRRKARIRRRVKAGAGERLRLSVFRSSKHIYAQVIDDVTGVTLVSASTVDGELRAEMAGKKKAEQANDELASRLTPAKVGKLVFDTAVQAHWLETGDRFP